MKQRTGPSKHANLFSGVIAVTVTLGCLLTPTAAYSGPALYWWHAPFTGSQSECVAWAQKIMPGDDDNPAGARAFESDYTPVVKCIKQAQKPLAVLIVTGTSTEKTKQTFDALKNRMFNTTPQ